MAAGWTQAIDGGQTALAGQQLGAVAGRSRSVTGIVCASFLLRCAQSSVAVMLGLYLAQLGANVPASAGIGGALLSSTFAVELALAPVFGTLSDRLGRKPLLIAGPLVGLVGIQVYTLSGGYAALFLGRALEGLSAA